METALYLLLQGLEAKQLCSKYLMEASWSSPWVSQEKFPFTKTCQTYQAQATTQKVETQNFTAKIIAIQLIHDCFVVSVRGNKNKYCLCSPISCLWNQRQIASWLLWQEGKINKSSKFRMDLWCTSSQVTFQQCNSVENSKFCNCGYIYNLFRTK